MVMCKPVHPGEVLCEDVLADLGLGVGGRPLLGWGLTSDVESGSARARSGQPESRRASGTGWGGHGQGVSGDAYGVRPGR